MNTGEIAISVTGLFLGRLAMLATAPDVAMCVLTQHPHAALERRVATSYALAETPMVLMNWCIFSDEGTAAERRDDLVVVLKRPELTSRRPQWQCVAKILAWLRHAHTKIASKLVGWIDSDTWLMPARLHTFLRSVVAVSAAHRRPAAAWIGLGACGLPRRGALVSGGRKRVKAGPTLEPISLMHGTTRC